MDQVIVRLQKQVEDLEARVDAVIKDLQALRQPVAAPGPSPSYAPSSSSAPRKRRARKA